MQGYRELREAACLIALPTRGAVRVGGEDRSRFLQGMLTADVAGLLPGQGCYAFQLDQRGHILADMTVLCGEDAFLLECEAERAPGIVGCLRQFAIADQVELLDCSAGVGMLAVEGPGAEAAVGSPGLSPWGHAETDGVTIVRCSWTGQPGYRLITGEGGLSALRSRFDELPLASAEALEVVRLEHGVPRLGVDFGESNFPQETGLMHAVAFDKGCYRGQETVERIRSRGQVNRRLAGFHVEGDPPAGGSPIEHEAAKRPVGEITSAAVSPKLGTIALGYVRREHLAPGTVLNLGGISLCVASLPFTRNPEMTA